MRGLLLLLAVALLAGCAEDGAPAPPTPLLEARESVAQFQLTAQLDPGTIRPGDNATVRFTLLNEGPPASYTQGGCGTEPWVLRIVAPNGTQVGPVGSDPRCLGPPLQEVVLATGGTVVIDLRWDGIRKWRDEAFEIQRAPAEPGAYTMSAKADVRRAGASFAPAAEVRVVVE